MLIKDTMCLIFSFLDPQSMGYVAQVCKQWHMYTKEDQIWQVIARRNFDKPILNFTETWQKCIKKIYKVGFLKKANYAKYYINVESVIDRLFITDRYLASTCKDSSIIRIFNLDSKQPCYTLKNETHFHQNLVMYNNYLYLGTSKGDIRTINLCTGKDEAPVFKCQKNTTAIIQLVIQQQKLIATSQEGHLHVWDIPLPTTYDAFLISQPDSRFADEYIIDNQQLACSFREARTLQVYDLKTKQKIFEQVHLQPRVNCVAFKHPHLIAALAAQVFIWNIENSTRQVHSISSKKQVHIIGLSIIKNKNLQSQNNLPTIVGENNGTIYLIDFKDFKILWKIEYNLPIYSLAIKSHLLFIGCAGTGNSESEIKIWNISTHTELRTLKDARCNVIQDIEYDGTRLIGGYQHGIMLWDFKKPSDAIQSHLIEWDDLKDKQLPCLAM